MREPSATLDENRAKVVRRVRAKDVVKEKGKADPTRNVGDLERKDPNDHNHVQEDTPTIGKDVRSFQGKSLLLETTCSINVRSAIIRQLLVNLCPHIDLVI